MRKKLPKNVRPQMVRKTMSIMNNQIIAKKAQQIDYAMLFKAQREHEFQLWSNNIDFLFK